MNLKDIRKEKGLLAKKVAQHLDISYRQFHRIETGEVAKVDKMKTEKLSEVYGVSELIVEAAWQKGATDNGNNFS